MPEITGQQALDVAIGLILVFFLLSVVCSAINEAFATALAWRSETLLAGLRSLLADDSCPPSRPRQPKREATAPAAAAGAPGVGTREPRQPTLSAMLDHPLPWKDDALRAAVVAQAQKAVDEGNTSDIDGGGDSNGKTVSESVDDVKELSLPIGWSLDRDDPRWPDDFWGFAGKLLGLSVTWIALTMGAPFWFDLLGRVSRVRGTGQKPAAETS